MRVREGEGENENEECVRKEVKHALTNTERR